MKKYIKYILLTALIVYSIIYVYDEITLRGGNTGLYMFFNIPLGLGQIYFSIRLLNTDLKWLKVIAMIGVITALLVLVPPPVYYAFL